MVDVTVFLGVGGLPVSVKHVVDMWILGAYESSTLWYENQSRYMNVIRALLKLVIPLCNIVQFVQKA